MIKQETNKNISANQRSYQRQIGGKGFTLIELLIVIALLGLFLTLTAPFGIQFYRYQIVDNETITLENSLKNAQSYAISGKEDSSWGIKFFDEYYILFAGDSYEEPERNSSFDKTFNLHQGVTVEGVEEIVFKKNSGRTMIYTGE